jgi:NADH-quinone oxidoreductase subunit A
MEVTREYVLVGCLLLLGAVIAAMPLLIPLALSPRYRGPKTLDTYECGIDTIGSAWTRFSIAFYLFALIFVAFEVDILYLFPIALVFGDPALGMRDIIEVAMFLGILSLGILFAWKNGVFKWS